MLAKKSIQPAQPAGEYVCEFWQDAEGLYHGRFPDLPKSEFSAATESRLDRAAREAFANWLKWAEEVGVSVPQPGSRAGLSGILRLRVSRSIHRRLLATCEKHHVALTNLVISMLHAGLDWLEGDLALPAIDACAASQGPTPVQILRKRRIDYSNAEPTGSWTQNIPLELHQRLQLMAEAENVGVNLLCNLLLSRVLFDMQPVEPRTRIESKVLRFATG